jgi:uncharacterized tellurite resistance protein B-like protein
MSFITSLRSALREVTGSEEAAPDHEERLTVAALLLLVCRVDGTVLKQEERSLPVLLRSYFGMSDDMAVRLVEEAEAEAESVDPAMSIADRIARDIPEAERPRLIELAYRVAAIDGSVHEFEDDLIWRIARLLEISAEEVAAHKEQALRNLVGQHAHG